jgi:FkbM family methyltransferase
MKRMIQIGDTRREIDSDDNYLARMGDVFEPHMTAVFKALVDPHMVVADVGANIGMTALLFSDLGRHVYAFEPGRSTFEIMARNVAQAENVEPVNVGMGERAEDQTLTFANTNRSGGFVSNSIKLQNQDYTTETIRIETLDGYFFEGRERPDFIKMDVEGFEPSVLRGAHALLAHKKPTVVLELNHFCLNVMQRVTLPDFFDQLRRLFPVLLAVDTGNERLANLHNSDAAYMVMHNHATRFRFPNIVAGFSEDIGPRLNRVVEQARKGA